MRRLTVKRPDGSVVLDFALGKAALRVATPIGYGLLAIEVTEDTEAATEGGSSGG